MWLVPVAHAIDKTLYHVIPMYIQSSKDNSHCQHIGDGPMARHVRIQQLPKLTVRPTPQTLSQHAQSLRCFSVLNRPPPNYQGHIPLTRLERLGLALGSGIGSFLDPRRGGTEQSNLRALASSTYKKLAQISSPHSAKQQPNPTSSTNSAIACCYTPRAAVSCATDRA